MEITVGFKNTQLKLYGMARPWRDKELLQELYWDQGMTINEVADELGCHKNTVHRCLHKTGLGTRKASQQKAVHFRTDERGHERWRHDTNGTQYCVSVHRLVAVAEYGLDAVRGKHVHHQNHIPWDNRPDNLVPLDPPEHAKIHTRRIELQGDLREYVYQRGYNLSEIAEAESVSHGTASRFVSESSVRYPFKPYTYGCILQYMVDNGHTLSEIADFFGISVGGLKTKLWENGVDGWRQDQETVADKYDGGRLRELYFDKDMTMVEIADEYDVSQGAVSQWFTKLGIETGVKTTEPDHTPWRDEQWLQEQYVNQDKSMRSISREVGCARSCISKWVKEHDLRQNA